MNTTLTLISSDCEAIDIATGKKCRADLWHWPDCPRCGLSRYGGPVVTGYCRNCEVNMTESPKAHARRNASSSDRWMACPGSLREIDALPLLPPPSSYALEGTAMHLAAAAWLSSGVEPDWPLATFCGLTLEDDCVDAVKVYRQCVIDDIALYGGELLVEHRFSLESLYPEMWGTNDAMLIRCKDHVLRVYDFKGGSGVPVEVEHNSQLLYYGYGAVLTAKAGPIRELELIIVQPRCRHNDGPVRRWRVDLIDAYDFAQDLVEAAKATDDPNAPLHAGDHCRWCPAAGACKEYERYALAQAEIDFGPPVPANGAGPGGGPTPLPDPNLMTPAELGALLPKLSVLEQWVTLVRNYAHAEAEAGRTIPGWKLVNKRGRRKWLDSEISHLVAELHGLGINDRQIFETPELKSPAQMEKLLPAKQRDSLRPYYETVSSGTVLAPDDDYREPLAGTGLAVFSPVPDGQSPLE